MHTSFSVHTFFPVHTSLPLAWRAGIKVTVGHDTQVSWPLPVAGIKALGDR